MVKKFLGAMVWLWPLFSYAWPACARASEDGRDVYYIATALMLLVPMGMIVPFFIWIRMASKKTTEPRATLKAEILE
jgi:hypothetical protein